MSRRERDDRLLVADEIRVRGDEERIRLLRRDGCERTLVVADADFGLYPVAGGPAVIQGVAFSVASYDRFSQRISNVRAARDAEIRDAKAIAEQIRNQITSRLAARH